jgi:hypothetical protein
MKRLPLSLSALGIALAVAAAVVPAGSALAKTTQQAAHALPT